MTQSDPIRSDPPMQQFAVKNRIIQRHKAIMHGVSISELSSLYCVCNRISRNILFIFLSLSLWMSTRPIQRVPQSAAAASASSQSPTSPSTDTAINLPGIRTRSVVLDHSLSNQWRGQVGKGHNTNNGGFVSDKQRLIVLIALFVIASCLIIFSLHFSHPRSAHPSIDLTHEHIAGNPHMLRQYNKLMSQHLASGAINATMIAAGVTSPTPSKTASPYSVLYVTVPSQDVGEKISRGLLEKNLIACSNMMPGVTSMYHWEGKIQKETEILMMLKTRSELFGEVAQFVKANHPYQVPEIIELPIQQGYKDYLQWIKENTKEPEDKP